MRCHQISSVAVCVELTEFLDNIFKMPNSSPGPAIGHTGSNNTLIMNCETTGTIPGPLNSHIYRLSIIEGASYKDLCEYTNPTNMHPTDEVVEQSKTKQTTIQT